MAGTDNELGDRQVRQVYLITYSQANEDVVTSREHFSEMVLAAYEKSLTAAKVLHWVCSQEYHQDGAIHYHFAVKLNKCHRWLSVRKHLATVNGINVHFSDNHYNYYSAWKYVTKEDGDAIQSPDHPDLGDGSSQQTEKASKAHHEMKRNQDGPSPRKKTRLSSYDVSQIAVSRGIKTRLALLALANQQKAEGKTDLAEFIVNRGKRVVNEAIEVS